MLRAKVIRLGTLPITCCAYILSFLAVKYQLLFFVKIEVQRGIAYPALQVGPTVVLVEEAGEIFESQILTAISRKYVFICTASC